MLLIKNANVYAPESLGIKDLLIDQKFVSGIGNIYASEILFLSRIDPSKKAKLLSVKNCSQIIKSSKNSNY